MAIDKKVYALNKAYTDESILGFGVQKGANCQIKSIVHQDGQNIVTFLWKNETGDERESVMRVSDGTPIYTYTVGDTYHYGDLVIYESCFYRCTATEYIAGPTLNHLYFSEIGAPEGNYDIVEDSSMLPPRFTPADRKLYYSIVDQIFFLWNGEEWIRQEKKATYTELGMVKIDEETLNIDEDAKVSIRIIGEDAINSLFV